MNDVFAAIGKFIVAAGGLVAIAFGFFKFFGEKWLNTKFEENMTMVFRAGDPAMLKAVKPGDRVRFVPDRINGQFTVMKIEKAKMIRL